jgi:LysR family glycine cleavage system transcriptional activator
MARDLPPLNALRAFEAAARQLSFAKAADELNVTPAAVSHQIKALEQRLGLPLFRRGNRVVFLTEAGQAYLGGVREGFDRLAEATARLRKRGRGAPLTVSVLPSFATRWLMPRLKRFRALHPTIDVRLSATQALADFARDDIDLAIRFGRGTYPGLVVEWLFAEDMFPVCSPELLRGPLPLAEPADLRHHTLLHDGMREDWRLWLEAAGVEGVDAERGPSFNDASLVVQAAVDGMGVAIGRGSLVAGELAAGRLVRLFAATLREGEAYYLVYPEANRDRPQLAAFREWILAEAAAEWSARLNY